ncbi:MAG: sulfurtransferase [Robiginitomaculum sp.]|nr:MAG: sulfurtransferase [Robiginitomaculum sp.]
MVKVIDRAELRSMLVRDENIVLIDALPTTAYARGHIPGAISIPSEDIIVRAPKMLTDRSTVIVVYCKNGPCRRSERAAARLESLGYTQVCDYHLGRDDWSEAGLPIEMAVSP